MRGCLDLEDGVIRPLEARGLRQALGLNAGGEMVSDLVLYKCRIVDIDRNEAFFFGDKRMLRTRLKEEAGQEDVLAGCAAGVAADVDDGNEV